MNAAVQVVRDMKRCPDCGQVKLREEFWGWNRPDVVGGGDGMFPYCIPCAKARKRKQVDTMTTQEQAVEAIRASGDRAAAAAVAWDEAALALCKAWRELTAAADTVRLNRAPAGSKCDYGALEMNRIHHVATYTLAISLRGAGYPWPGSLLLDESQPRNLAAFVGAQPHLPYLPGVPSSDAVLGDEPRPKRRKHG